MERKESVVTPTWLRLCRAVLFAANPDFEQIGHKKHKTTQKGMPLGRVTASANNLFETQSLDTRRRLSHALPMLRH
jgi:hypothetical protein